MEILIKAAAIGIVASIIGLVVKKNSPEMALILTVSAGIIIIGLAVTMFSGLKNFIEDLADTAGISQAIILPVIKTIGIAIAGRIASDICSDAGYSSSASAIELVAAVSAIYVSMPLMKMVIQMLQSFM
ncbi:MAG: hypothetical protein GX254_09165 [Clostridiales bacterium]|jgi:stage III sporulation protein AD|nr:hypothetical protein [Clostridiales bacterium]